MKTMLELAQEMGVAKSTIYRCIKKRCIATVQRNGVTYLDATAETQVKCALQGNESLHDATGAPVQGVADATAMIRLLQQTIEQQTQQLEAKDRQIAELMELHRNQQVLLKQEQDRHRPFWQRLFLPAPRVQTKGE